MAPPDLLSAGKNRLQGNAARKSALRTMQEPEDEKMNEIMKNIDKLHTTEMGTERIKRNLCIRTEDVVEWCRAQILKEDASMERKGKNWYITVNNCVITVNARSYTIITAHCLS